MKLDPKMVTFLKEIQESGPFFDAKQDICYNMSVDANIIID